MPQAFVKNPALRDLTQRLAFRAPLFSSETSSQTLTELGWDTPVEILGEGPDRTRVRTAEGTEGFLRNEDWVRIAYADRDHVQGEWRYKTPLYENESGSKRVFDLLWGDRLQVMEQGASRTKVAARGRIGWVKNQVVDGASLLEVYFIDVGQGDGVLIRTPDHRHLLLDGGYPRVRQPTGKNAADFVDWKFFKDYAGLDIVLDALMASHCDLDHYGGLWDLLSDDSEARRELDTRAVSVSAFYHAGVSWWRPGDRWLGPTEDGCLVDLLDDLDSIRAALEEDADPRLQGNWSDFLEHVARLATSAKRLGVSGPTDIQYVTGFGPGGDTTLRVLGPLVKSVDGQPAVEDLGVDSQNTNGHSLVLMLQHGNARILLTGDLNKASHQRILETYGVDTGAFACDVAKGCHHGSDDVSYAFLQAMNAAATVISSGDNEGHAHPRPSIVAASAVTGFRTIDTERDELRTPLVYMTEIERSVQLGQVHKLTATDYPLQGGTTATVAVYALPPGQQEDADEEDAEAKRDVRSRVSFKIRKPSAFRAEKKERSFWRSQIVSGIVYGLVNVRTDGEQILCATMNEDDEAWNIHTFPARF